MITTQKKMVSLDAQSIELAQQIGRGNVSRGIRQALIESARYRAYACTFEPEAFGCLDSKTRAAKNN